MSLKKPFALLAGAFALAMGPGGAITSSSVGADGVRVTARGRLSGNSGGGTYTRADGCVGNWTATRN